MLSERWLFHKVIPYGFHPKNSIGYVYNYDSMNSFHMESPWNPPTKSMESIRKVHGIHQKSHGIHVEMYGIHVEKVWNPDGKTMESIPHSMESIHHSMESIHQKYGIHPPFHGIHLEFLQSTPHSMDSTWNNPGRVKYCIFINYFSLLASCFH